jgi:hypothetical protein
VTVSIDLDRLLSRDLDAAEQALDLGVTPAADLALNAAARRCRELGVANTSERYRRLSLGAARQALGQAWNEGADS